MAVTKGMTLTRILFRAVLASLFVVQLLGLSKVLASSAHADAFYGVASAEHLGGVCLARSGHETPSPAHHDPSDCCTACSGNAHDDALLAILSLAAVFDIVIPEADSVFHYHSPGDLPRRHEGWGSSWSAQAPPFA